MKTYTCTDRIGWTIQVVGPSSGEFLIQARDDEGNAIGITPRSEDAPAIALAIFKAADHPLASKVEELVGLWNLQQRNDDKVRAYLNKVLLNPVSHLYRITDHDRAEYARAAEFFQEES